MFEKNLETKLKRIFGLPKVTFDRPSESQEQEAVFIVIENAKCRVKDGRAIARVTGKLLVYAAIDQLPYGYFSKRIEDADPDDLAGLFFYEFEENRGMFRNLAERSVSFVYLFDEQYDPAVGTITSINFSLSENEP